jgi:hypothetical protein
MGVPVGLAVVLELPGLVPPWLELLELLPQAASDSATKAAVAANPIGLFMLSPYWVF